MANGHRFGWSHDEGAHVSEWWHVRYVGLSPSAYKRATRSPTRPRTH